MSKRESSEMSAPRKVLRPSKRQKQLEKAKAAKLTTWPMFDCFGCKIPTINLFGKHGFCNTCIETIADKGIVGLEQRRKAVCSETVPGKGYTTEEEFLAAMHPVARLMSPDADDGDGDEGTENKPVEELNSFGLVQQCCGYCGDDVEDGVCVMNIREGCLIPRAGIEVYFCDYACLAKHGNGVKWSERA